MPNLSMFAYIDLEVLHEGGCTLYEVRKALGRNVKKKACSEKRMTFEQNAICTRHNVTYANPFKALCAMRPRLREKIGGVCGCPFQRSCEKAHELQQSLRSAPINERTKFVVCGSDWRTYRSQHHLECTRRYNSCMLHAKPIFSARQNCFNKIINFNRFIYDSSRTV